MSLLEHELDYVWEAIVAEQHEHGNPIDWIEGKLWRGDGPDPSTRAFIQFIIDKAEEIKGG